MLQRLFCILFAFMFCYCIFSACQGLLAIVLVVAQMFTAADASGWVVAFPRA
ncbi:hypothetical protein EV13_0991 [Prochlorococcus sp. MIT 0702]|nr:hypothetical protein EV12_0388 [Prochlorococcus sp. MIT 0701]KGG29772.1 hypothetical protein EV13_0991 [Prochlorococcus sp. MIT 0702]KGG34327.1 hypothetical protein EV14_1422 [Prochlorococcus sp. MIT 0703]